MRVCPKCGYEDPICWRPAAYHQEFSYTDFSSLELLDPLLWELLRQQKRGVIVRRDPFLFWRSSRSDVVRRIWIEDFKRVGKKGNPQEKVRFYEQQLLMEAEKP